MAKRRCINIDVLESESFMELPCRVRMLYINFILRADDQGVVINPMVVKNVFRASKKEMAELIDSGFVLKVGDVFVIRHWHIHNKMHPSKMTKSVYQQELSMLYINDKMEYEYLEEP